MAELKPEPIRAEDLSEYLESSSDFSFELSTLRMLTSLGLKCAHGGLYDDPVTGKAREFDIRAVATASKTRIRLAIECKNIRENFPVLVSCVPRKETESYHEIAFVGDQEVTALESPLGRSRASIHRVRGANSLYPPTEMVGKRSTQVGRDSHGRILENDRFFEKWSQCLSSAAELVQEVYWDGEKDEGHYLSTVIPFVVIPDGRLWIATYAEDGAQEEAPRQVDRCSVFVGKDYKMGTTQHQRWLTVSHLEIVTSTGLNQFVATYLLDKPGVEKVCPLAAILKE